MIRKSDFPILEYDDQKTAVIEPSEHFRRYPVKLPPNLIITFFHEVVSALLAEKQIELVYTISGENKLPVYQFIGRDVVIVCGIVGAPACAGFYEDLVAHGVSNTIFCGGGGALHQDLKVGKLLVVNGAIRDEGFSYHYLPPARVVDHDPAQVAVLAKFLDSRQIAYIKGLTWTTDAFYRETTGRIALRKSEGAVLVEMEQAAMLAVSIFRNVKYNAIIYAGDDVSGSQWDLREWRSRAEIRRHLVELCLDYLGHDMSAS